MVAKWMTDFVITENQDLQVKGLLVSVEVEEDSVGL